MENHFENSQQSWCILICNEKLHSKIPLISITLLIKQISPGVWTVFGCFHLGARSYIVIGSHITGLNPVWDSRWLDILCKFYFHRFGDFFCWFLFANESFWKYICDFIDTIHNHSRGGTIWKNAFFDVQGFKRLRTPQLHWVLFTHMKLWLFAHCNINILTDLHKWQVMAAPQSPHSDRIVNLL